MYMYILLYGQDPRDQSTRSDTFPQTTGPSEWPLQTGIRNLASLASKKAPEGPEINKHIESKGRPDWVSENVFEKIKSPSEREEVLTFIGGVAKVRVCSLRKHLFQNLVKRGQKSGSSYTRLL